MTVKTQKTSSTIAFGLGAMTDQMNHQAFQFMVFVYYYAVVGISTSTLALSFIVFAIWDSINDPLIGPISDRTKSKLGRRRFWVLISLLPLGAVSILLYTPPASERMAIFYMIAIIMFYDLAYTMFSANQTALFSEMFTTEKERTRANAIKNTLTVVGLLIGFALPTFLINPMVPDAENSAELLQGKYLTAGIVVGVLTVGFGFLFFKFGMKEPENQAEDIDKMPSILTALKQTFQNKSFMIFIFANMFQWFVFKLLTTVISLYGSFVLEIQKGDFTLTAMLLSAFLVAAASFPFLAKLTRKIGVRKSFMVTNVIWIITLIPFWFLGPETKNLAVPFMMLVGIGLGGAMYHVDILIANIIDEDELKFGQRRAGTFYGVNSLINRYSTILVFLALTLVLQGYGWGEFLGGASASETANMVSALRILFVALPIGGILVVLICLAVLPLRGARLDKVKEEIEAKRSQESELVH